MSNDNDLVHFAREFAAWVHRDQKMKYNQHAPYFRHVHRVACTLINFNRPVVEVVTGYLHDCMEDQDITQTTLEQLFGNTIANLVFFVTKSTMVGTREERAKNTRLKLQSAPAAAKNVKLADIATNVIDVVDLDPKFAETYLPEKRAQLEVLRNGADKELYEHTKQALEIAENKLAYIKGEREEL
jgi:(p)ppGpp synthase/HD superfamily hydrolase